jgi:hypothetical protein
MLHLQEFIRGPLNVLPDLVTVSRSVEKRPQDEHVKRSLEEPDPLLRLLRHRRHSTLNLARMVDSRLSIVNGRRRVWILECDFMPTHSLTSEIELNFPVPGGLSAARSYPETGFEEL